jgi:outer membrane protein OmpA-like peptidoglycan-associated protein
MKKLLFLLVYCSLSIFSFAQPYDPLKVNKQAIPFFNMAMEKAQDGNVTEAIVWVKKAIETDGKYLEAYLLLAGFYKDVKKYNESIAAYEKAFAIDSVFAFDYKLAYSISLAGKGEFEKALQMVNNLLAAPRIHPRTRSNAEARKLNYEFAVNYTKNNANTNYVFAPQNMGDAINTAESEYFPSMTIDNKEFVFTRRLQNSNEDFYISRRRENDWEKASPMSGNVNTPMNEGAQNISQDGQWLVFTACDRRDGFGGCDIYLSFVTDGGWSEAINLGPKVNSGQWDSQPSLSPDKRQLFFASKRPGGLGGSDIYVCNLLPGGRWSDPENMGPSINTPGDDQSPFIHADNQTLYFTSNGHPGYGDADLYYVRKGPTGAWGKPVNLGYPINTINQEATLFIAADGKTAYYSSDKEGGKGAVDIYSFELREDVRPIKTLYVKGQVFDNKTKQGLPSSVELIDLSNKELLSKLQTDEKGNYLVTLPVGKDYAFNVNRKGYLFYSGNFSLSRSSADSTYERNIPLQPIEVNAAVVLNNVFFDVNKFDLKPESQVELDKLLQLLAENPSLKIEIGGHTDNVGKPADNLNLSNSRAKAVVNYLVSKGIPLQRLTAKGYGETKPMADNKTEAGRALNRRTEMKVVSQ